MVSFSNWDVCPQTYGWFQGSLLTNHLIMTVLRTSIPMPMLMIAFSEHCKFIVIKIYDKYLAFKFQLPPLTAPLPLPKCEVCDTAKLCPAWSLLGWVCSPAVRHPAYLRYVSTERHIYISTLSSTWKSWSLENNCKNFPGQRSGHTTHSAPAEEGYTDTEC